MRLVVKLGTAVGLPEAVDKALSVHTDHEHIHIVKAAVSVIGDKACLLLCYALYGCPAVLYIVGGAPEMCACGLYPFLSFFHSPRASAEYDISAAVGESRSHSSIEELALKRSRVVAEVIL